MANDDSEIRVKYKKTTEHKIEGQISEDQIKRTSQDYQPKSSVDSINAPGYNQNLPKETDSSLPKKGLEPPKQTMPGQGAAPQPINPLEGAPDIDKDYGEGMDPNYNGYKNNGLNENEGTKLAQKPEIENPYNNNANQQTPSKNKGLDKEDSGLPPKDNLKKNSENHSKEDLKNVQKEKYSEEEKSKKTNKDLEKQPKDTSAYPENNGYGSLKKNRGSQLEYSDGTQRARRNLEHSKRIQEGREETKSNGSKKAQTKKTSNSQGPKTSSKGSLGTRLKNGLGKLGKNKSQDSISEGGKGGKRTKRSFTDNIKKIGMFIAKRPYVAITIGVIIIIFLILIISCIDDYNGKRGTHCTYNLKGVTSTGEVKLEGLQVELINCDGKASSYTVLETVDFEKYVLGVALAEIGPSSPDEAIKAQIIAARGFALRRNSGMCPSNQDGCFYGYNASTNKIRMRACEADQVYWDYDKDIYRQERGAISIYSPEINSGTLWKSALSEERKAQVLALAEDVKGKVLVDSNNVVVSTNYINTVSEQFIIKANEGKTYDQILAEVYTESDGFSTGHCTSYGNIDYGDYVLSSEGHEILHTPLESFLKSKGTSLEEFNSLIASNVDRAGYGTRAGVVAAAVTLIGELGNNYGVKVPYYWGGGHYDGVVDGALGYWGSTQCHTYANNTSYNYCGLDCSGFVPWAIKNGGFNMTQRLAHTFKDMAGVKKVTLTNSPVLEPGDLLESSEHVVLVVGIEESTGNYICAEASGNAAGVLFTRRSFKSPSYWGVKMDGYYAQNARSR